MATSQEETPAPVLPMADFLRTDATEDKENAVPPTAAKGRAFLRSVRSALLAITPAPRTGLRFFTAPAADREEQGPGAACGADAAPAADVPSSLPPPSTPSRRTSILNQPLSAPKRGHVPPGEGATAFLSPRRGFGPTPRTAGRPPRAVPALYDAGDGGEIARPRLAPPASARRKRTLGGLFVVRHVETRHPPVGVVRVGGGYAAAGEGVHVHNGDGLTLTAEGEGSEGVEAGEGGAVLPSAKRACSPPTPTPTPSPTVLFTPAASSWEATPTTPLEEAEEGNSAGSAYSRLSGISWGATKVGAALAAVASYSAVTWDDLVVPDNLRPEAFLVFGTSPAVGREADVPPTPIGIISRARVSTPGSRRREGEATPPVRPPRTPSVVEEEEAGPALPTPRYAVAAGRAGCRRGRGSLATRILRLGSPGLSAGAGPGGSGTKGVHAAVQSAPALETALASPRRPAAALPLLVHAVSVHATRTTGSRLLAELGLGTTVYVVHALSTGGQGGTGRAVRIAGRTLTCVERRYREFRHLWRVLCTLLGNAAAAMKAGDGRRLATFALPPQLLAGLPATAATLLAFPFPPKGGGMSAARLDARRKGLGAFLALLTTTGLVAQRDVLHFLFE